MSKKYVQVDGTFFKIVIEKGIPSLIQVKPDEAISQEMEDIVLTDSEELNVSMFQEIIDNARTDLKDALERNLKSTVLATLGFEKDRWGNDGFRIDHCNGRMSVVTDLISKEIKAKLLSADFDVTDAEKEQLRLEMQKDFRESYKRKVRELTWNNAEKLARTHVDEMLSEMTKGKLQEIATAMLEKAVKNTK